MFASCSGCSEFLKRTDVNVGKYSGHCSGLGTLSGTLGGCSGNGQRRYVQENYNRKVSYTDRWGENKDEIPRGKN